MKTKSKKEPKTTKLVALKDILNKIDYELLEINILLTKLKKEIHVPSSEVDFEFEIDLTDSDDSLKLKRGNVLELMKEKPNKQKKKSKRSPDSLARIKSKTKLDEWGESGRLKRAFEEDFKSITKSNTIKP